MNGLWKGLLVVSLLLATVPVACAESPTDKVDPAQPASAVSDAVSLPNEGQAAGVKPQEVGQSNAVAPAPELIKVSSLEPSVSRSAVVAAADRQLELRRADFLKFAEKKLKDMNRNHILSRERMRIEKQASGGYQACPAR